MMRPVAKGALIGAVVGLGLFLLYWATDESLLLTVSFPYAALGAELIIHAGSGIQNALAVSMVAVLCAVQFALYGALVARVPRRGLGVVAVCLLHLMGMFLLSSL